MAFLGEQSGQGWTQLAELGLAFVLSALLGQERDLPQERGSLHLYVRGVSLRTHHARSAGDRRDALQAINASSAACSGSRATSAQ
jgi:hypothetical protein